MTSTVLDPRANTAYVIARSLMPGVRAADVIDVARTRFHLDLTPAEARTATQAARSTR